DQQVLGMSGADVQGPVALQSLSEEFRRRRLRLDRAPLRERDGLAHAVKGPSAVFVLGTALAGGDDQTGGRVTDANCRGGLIALLPAGAARTIGIHFTLR